MDRAVILSRRSAMQAFCQNPDQISFRSAVCQVEIRCGERVDQGANEICAADTGAVCGPNVCDQPIKKNNLPIHQHHCDFRPAFGVRRSTSSALRDVRLVMPGLSESRRLHRGRCQCCRVFFEQHLSSLHWPAWRTPDAILMMRCRSVTFRTAMDGKFPRCSFEMLPDTRRRGGRLPLDVAPQSTYPAYRRPQ